MSKLGSSIREQFIRYEPKRQKLFKSEEEEKENDMFFKVPQSTTKAVIKIIPKSLPTFKTYSRKRFKSIKLKKNPLLWSRHSRPLHHTHDASSQRYGLYKKEKALQPKSHHQVRWLRKTAAASRKMNLYLLSLVDCSRHSVHVYSILLKDENICSARFLSRFDFVKR